MIKVYVWFFMGNKDLIRKMGDIVNVPKDVTQGFPYLSILGNSDIYIENYRGILEYTRETIRIETKLGRIEIIGKHLHIDYYSNEDLKIKGLFHKIEFQSGGKTC